MINRRRVRIYVAGPLSTGDRLKNLQNATDAGHQLIKLGYAPLIPHLTHYMDNDDSLYGSETWLSIDLPWLAVSDAILRLPGASNGADIEVNYANELGIPVFTSIDELKKTDPTKGEEQFHTLLNKLGKLHAKKQQDYGKFNDPYSNVRASEDFGIRGWIGAMVRANDKVRRIQKFAKDGELANEAVEDSFLDLAVYSLIGLILFLEEKNDGARQV